MTHTKSPFFSTFKNKKDHNNWEKQKEYFLKSNELDSNLKKEIISSINFLKQEFGKGFLKTAKHNHPIKNYLFNKALHSIKWINWFVDVLKNLKEQKTDCNYHLVISKLKKHDSSIKEGIPFIEIASQYIKSGFEVIFLSELEKTKTPDLKIINPVTQEFFYIEVSTLNESLERENSWNDFLTITGAIQKNCSPIYSGKLFEPLTSEEREFIYKEIPDLARKAVFESDFLEIEKHSLFNKLEIAMCNEKGVDKLKKWCERKNYKFNQLDTPAANFNETLRLKKNDKLRKKFSQIPKGELGLIYIKVDSLYLMTYNPFDIVKELEPVISNYKNILGLVLYGSIWDNEGEREFQIGLNLHYFSHFIFFEQHKRYQTLIFNKECTSKITGNSLHKIYSTFSKF